VGLSCLGASDQECTWGPLRDVVAAAKRPAAVRRRRRHAGVDEWLHAALERLGLATSPPGDDVYHAFISYNRAADGRLAAALQRGLQRFAKPWYRTRALRVFRDDVSLSAQPSLWSSNRRGARSVAFLHLARLSGIGAVAVGCQGSRQLVRQDMSTCAGRARRKHSRQAIRPSAKHSLTLRRRSTELPRTRSRARKCASTEDRPADQRSRVDPALPDRRRDLLRTVRSATAGQCPEERGSQSRQTKLCSGP